MTVKEKISERRRLLEEKYPVWERKTLGDRLDDFAREYGEREYVFTLQKRYTYKEFQSLVNTMAKGMLRLGIKNREHVAIILPNNIQFLISNFALPKIGAVNVLLNYRYRQDELAYVLRQSDSVCLIAIDKFLGLNFMEMLQQLCPEFFTTGRTDVFPRLRQIIVVSPEGKKYPSTLDFDEVMASGQTVPDEELQAIQSQVRYPDEVVDILYTSGTTGQPKGVMLTHDMLWRNAYSSCLSRGFEDGRRLLCPLPMYHIFAYGEGVLAVMFVGGCLVPLEVFTPDGVLELMEKARTNDLLCVPTMLMEIVNSPNLKKYDTSAMRACANAAAPTPVWLWEKARQELGLVELATGYGGTEFAGAPVHTEPGDPLEKLFTSIGRIDPPNCTGLPEYGGCNVECKVVDPITGADLPPGAEGELAWRGPVMTKGFYNKPMETAAAIDKDGWVRTGDLGIIGPDGYFQLTGRSKELYRIGGENVAPKEIEETIGRHPKVSQVYVVGVPDEKMGEVGMAYIELKTGEECTAEEIINYCRERLARFKVPRYVKFISATELPLTSTGKVQKFRLVERAVEELGLQDVAEKFKTFGKE